MIGITDPAKKRGLFGKPVEYYGTPPIHNPMQHTPEMRQAAQPAPQQGGKNPSVLPYALAGLQDFVALRMGYRPQGVATLNAQTAQQQQAAADAAAAQRKRAQELADWQWKQDYQNANKSAEVGVFEDNAGNRWTYDKATGKPIADAPVFIDSTPKEFVHEGMRFSIQNPFLRGQNGGNIPRVTDEASYNALPAGSQFYDDEGQLRTKSGGPASAPGNFPGQ